MSLKNAAMLLHLTISMWQGLKMDSRLTDAVKSSFQIKSTDDSYRKALVPSSSLAPIRELGTKIRNCASRFTSPWHDGGVRILPSSSYFEFQAEITKLITEFDTKVKEFLDSYPKLLSEAQVDRGTSFNALDYPDVDDLAARFGIDLKITAINDAADFRVDLPESELEKLRAQAKEAETQLEGKLVQDVRERLLERLTLLERACTGAKFKSATVDDLPAFAKKIEALNVMNDETIGSACIFLSEFPNSEAIRATPFTKLPEIRAWIRGLS